MRKRIVLLLSLAMVFMMSVTAFAEETDEITEVPLLYEPGLGYEVDLDNPSDTEALGLPYVEGLGYEVVIPDDIQITEDVITSLSPQAVEASAIGNYDSGWKSFLGGKWKHGVNRSVVYSTFKHSKKTHQTTVQGSGGKMTYSGWKAKGIPASASMARAISGNRAWADVKK